MFLPGDDNTNEILQLISSSQKLDLAVAFFGRKAESLLSGFTPGGRIICNLRSGGTNPNVVKELLAEGAFDIRENSFLHAKVYIGDNGAIVSSANLSANGLGLEAEELFGWQEAGYKVTNQKELENIRKWFSELWGNSTKITDDAISEAMDIWGKRRISRPSTGAKKSIFQALRDNPETLQDRNIYLVITSEFLTDKADNALKSLKKINIYGPNVDAYENWSELPENSYFIDVSVNRPVGTFSSYNGLFKSPVEKTLYPFDKDKNEDKLYLCHEKKDFFGYVMTEEDKDLLKRKVVELLQSNADFTKNGCCFIPLIDAKNILFA